ncbi:rhomboid family intramembrane serine protease [Candidatus Undinarchaeota archaeon]
METPGMKLNIGKGTLWLVGLVILGFVLQIAFPEFMFENFALVYSLIGTEPWRLISYMFVHGGFDHLLLNLFSILFFGLILEKDIGSKMFFLVYFVAGILGGYMQAYLFPAAPSIGASAAAYGILGMLAILRPMMIVIFVVPLPMIVVAIGWAASSYLLISLEDGIGHAAHLFGLVVGVVFGIIWRLTHKSKGIDGNMSESGE